MRVVFKQNPFYISTPEIDGALIEYNQLDWITIRRESGEIVDFRYLGNNFFELQNVEVGEEVTISFNPSTIFNFRINYHKLLRDLYVVFKWCLANINPISVEAEKPSTLEVEGLPNQFILLDSHIKLSSSDISNTEEITLRSKYNRAGRWVHTTIYQNLYILTTNERPVVLDDSFNEVQVESVEGGIYLVKGSGRRLLICSRIV